MTCDRPNCSTSVEIPNFNCRAIADAVKLLTIWANGDRVNPVGMTFKGVEFSAIAKIPNFNRFIRTTTNQNLTEAILDFRF